MLEYEEIYINYLKSLNYSNQTIKSKVSYFRSFENYLKKVGIKNSIKNYTKKILQEYYLYLTKYKYKIADNSETGYLREKSRRKYITKKLVLNTILSRIYALKSYINYLLDHGKMYENPFEKIELPKYQDTLKLDITENDIEKLINEIDTKTFLGYRDRTIIELIYSTGLRRKEVKKLSIYDIDFNENILKVNQGKGRKDRIIPLGNVIKSYLKEYIINVRKYLLSINNMFNDILFVNSNGDSLSIGSIGRIIRLYAIKSKMYHITTHKLRHAFALHMMRKGCDIRYIQEILGHENLETTTVYTSVFDHDLKEKILKYHPRDHELNEKIDVEEIKKICKKTK